MYFNFSDCNKFKNGNFEIKSIYGGKILIKRTAQYQTETVTRNGNVARYKIKWKTKCTYLLFDRKLLKGKEEITDVKFREKLDRDTIYNEIVEVTGNEARVKSKLGNFPDVLESICKKVK